MKKLLLSALVLGLAACSQDAETPATDAAPEQEAAAPQRPAMEDIDLEGSWTLAGFGAESIPDTVKMTITADGETLRVRSGCANMSWPYTVNGNIIDTGEGSGEASGCAADRTTWEYSIGQIMDDANIVMTSGEGQVQISGPGGSVTLAKAG